MEQRWDSYRKIFSHLGEKPPMVSHFVAEHLPKAAKGEVTM
jgi:hypothetical protein